MNRTLLLLFALVSFSTVEVSNAEIVSNGSFSNGDFAEEGDSNFVTFGANIRGTLILPGQSILSDWEVSLSEFDPDNSLSFSEPGLEWTENDFNIDRAIDFNRGGDLWRISQTLNTVAGQRYRLVHDIFSGQQFGGATLRILISGNCQTTIVDSKSVSSGPNRFEEFEYFFTADSALTNLSIFAIQIGPDPTSGPIMNNISITAVPEPIPGDVNFDGSVDFSDIPSFIAILLNQ